MPRNRLAGDRLLVKLNREAHHAANKADLMRLDPTVKSYAYLFDRAAAFWRDLKYLTENDWPMSRDQRFALDWVAGGKEKAK